jgi:hypothetical protein
MAGLVRYGANRRTLPPKPRRATCSRGHPPDVGTAVAVLSGRVRPQVRLIAAPEIIVRDAPLIHYT